MNKNRGLTIAALIVAIIGLSIGFAAFSNTLTISSSATVNPSDENFIVQFSKYSDSDATGELNPITPTALTSDYGENGLIPTSDKKKLQDLHATFTEPGQSVTYELYVRNTGAYVAYLKDLVFANAEHATSGETYKHCYAATKDSNNQDIAPANQATGTLVTQACNGISISVSIGASTNITPDSASKSLGNQALQANGGNVQAIITISYNSNAAYVDGPMEVEFGDISFTSSTNPGTSQQEQGSQGGNEQGGQEEPQATSVVGTYITSIGFGSLQIQLNNDGTAQINSSMDGTYVYDSTNSAVTVDVGGNSMEYNFASVNGNNILYKTQGTFMLLSTNGLNGLTTLSGTYSGTSGSITFNSNGDFSDGTNTGNYAVIDNEVSVYVSNTNTYTAYSSNDNFQTLSDGTNTYTLQS